MILDKLTRKKIFNASGKPVEILWPKDANEPVVGNKYTVQTSADKEGIANIIVQAVSELPDGWKATVKIDGDPVRLLGKAAGYSTSSQGAIGTRKPRDAAPINGPQFRSEVEQEVALPANEKHEPFFPPPRLEDVPSGGRVKVTKPNAETGEVVVEGAVPASRFRRKATEAEVQLLSPEFKRRVLVGELPGLIFPADQDPPILPGDEIAINTKVSIEVLRVTSTKGGDRRARYIVKDFRATIPRRVPKMFEMPELDQDGFPIKPSKDAIEAATLDGNYCEDASQSVPEIAEEVEVKYRRGLGVSARARAARRKRMEDPEKEAARDIGPLLAEMREIAKRAAKMGLDPAPFLAPIAREIERAHADLSESREAA